MSFLIPKSQPELLTVLCPYCKMIITTGDERTLKIRVKLHFKKCPRKFCPVDVDLYIQESHDNVKKQTQQAAGHKIYKSSKKLKDQFDDGEFIYF